MRPAGISRSALWTGVNPHSPSRIGGRWGAILAMAADRRYCSPRRPERTTGGKEARQWTSGFFPRGWRGPSRLKSGRSRGRASSTLSATTATATRPRPRPVCDSPPRLSRSSSCPAESSSAGWPTPRPTRFGSTSRQPRTRMV